jgi:FHA domain
MREGHISSEELVSTLAHFVPGSGRLLLLNGGRFVFVAQGDVPFDFSGELSRAQTNRDFFLACIERWFAAGSKPDLVAGVVDIDCTAVLAIGRAPVLVQTATTSGLIDPSLASFAAEQTFDGGLVSLKVGDVLPLIGTKLVNELCWAANGLLPADAFVLMPALFSMPSPLSLQVSPKRSTQFAEPKTVIAEMSGSVPDQCGQAPETSVEGAVQPSTAPVNLIPPMLGTPSDLSTAYNRFDEDLDGATVWPTAGRRSSVASSGQQPIVTSAEGDMQDTPVPLRPDAALFVPTPVVGGATPPSELGTPQIKTESESAQVDRVVDIWEPPAPEPSTFIRSTPTFGFNASHPAPQTPLITAAADSGLPVAMIASPLAMETSPPRNVSETMTWGGPASKAERMPELDGTELTIMAGDLARIRRTFVEVAPTSDELLIGTLIGVYCRGGHFTDSRSQRCLFCTEETDLDTMTSAAAPLLGVMAFDDNRVTPVTGLVLVGRKPSTNDPSITAVSFGEDMMLSRVHFEVRLVDWDVSVVDKQSANGTQIEHPDGRRIVARPNIEVRLEPGSIVRFGNHQATFRRF